jgi:hypothetical protein
MSRFPPSLEPVEDLGPAEWVRQALKDWPAGRFHVRELVPPVFEAYARVLHRPLLLSDGREPSETWRERAAELGRSFTSETRLTELEVMDPTGSVEEGWSLNEGSLSVSEATTLSSFLAAHTPDPTTCWFAVWSGFTLDTASSYLLAHGGSLRQRLETRRVRLREWREARKARRAARRVATFDLLGQSGRSYVLIDGAIEDAGRFTFSPHFQSPTLWWPNDQSWFVHTEIDASSTYVGGSEALVRPLVDEQLLECFEVSEGSLAAL